MNHTRKMVIVPEESLRKTQEPEQPKTEKKRIERDFDKVHKIILIALKLARHNGYNDDLKLIDEDGNVLERSDLVSLLNHALTHQKLLFGEERFIELLYESNVNPDWIVNENIKSKLLSMRRTTTIKKIHSPERIRESSSPMPDIEQLNRDLKRKREENEDIPVSKKPRVSWETVEDDDDEMG